MHAMTSSGYEELHLLRQASESVTGSDACVARSDDCLRALRRSSRPVGCLAGIGLLAAGVLTWTRGSHGRVGARDLARHGQFVSRQELLDASQDFRCKDTPGWADGWSACAYDHEYGKNSSRCALTPGAEWPSARGWTCEHYRNMGWCSKGQPIAHHVPALNAPALQYPGQHCCACGGGNISTECPVDTGDPCVYGGAQTCLNWRGPTKCFRGRCICKPGYCLGAAGTCQLTVRTLDPEQQPQCARQTKSLCIGILPTPVSILRGTATCNRALNRAVCKPGMCSDSENFCFQGMGLVTAEVVPVNEDSPSFPGPHGEVKTALCLSGGGSRAAAMAIGFLRSLRDQGLLGKFDALSSVSGGTWASSLFMFAKEDLSTLLGDSTTPASLSLTELDRLQATALAVLSNSTTRITNKLTLAGIPEERMWVEATSTAFLESFGLGDLDSFMASDGTQVASIKARNPQYANSTFHVPQPGRPKVFVMGGSVLAPARFEMSNENTVSLQMSPDYVGWPFYPNNAPVRSFKRSAFLTSGEVPSLGDNDVLLGGGLIESFAFGSTAPLPEEQAGGPEVTLQAPLTPFSLARAVGISSAAFGGALSQIGLLGESFDPMSSMWPVGSTAHNTSQRAMTFQLGDGAMTDNSGLLAMLQRGASKIVMVVASSSKLDAKTDWCGISPSDSKLAEKIDQTLAGKFGFAYWSNDFMFAIKNDKVFASEGLQPIVCEMQQLKQKGRPQNIRRQLKVEENKWWGIKGGWTVDIPLASRGARICGFCS
ncbi:unnamed protein product [Prorocentrum cordatum]|uniref:PNPLA domain-containing protein n=1 Tax=Prorocentrum cordatum TaxID=2364126 RepID=A0ABN9RIB3_9DINO|nr:unnamed protein product [Polarella glacialis]